MEDRERALEHRPTHVGVTREEQLAEVHLRYEVRVAAVPAPARAREARPRPPGSGSAA